MFDKKNLFAGVDEAGRGPLAGPVYAAAVVLHPEKPIAGLKDSKKLSANTRDQLFDIICRDALAWSCAFATVDEIEQHNILQASLLAMQRAVMKLEVALDGVLVDGNQAPNLPFPVETIIRGDALIPAISAASIVAKVLRDREMCVLDKQFPQYCFAKHKGYGTALHIAMLRQFGPSAVHRKGFIRNFVTPQVVIPSRAFCDEGSI
ncbi:MAG: ribonuclease HII [Gammaproteobacteria bacterium RIFCSPHIGHO2_12_FULL_42_10]|nr:MAG: ribonuclease HII [Gammaproteobacteria bacterium RIFCSPHIGHO2_12_FULL_42_10]